MGLVAGQARLLLLTSRRLDLEFDMQRITQQRTNMAQQAQALMNDEQATAQVQAMDKNLELKQKEIETQHKAVETEYESAKKIVDKNIEGSFKYFA